MEAKGDLAGITLAGRYQIQGRRGMPLHPDPAPRGMFDATDVRLGHQVAVRLVPLSDMVEPLTTSRKSPGDARRAIQQHLQIAMETLSPALAPMTDWGDTDIAGVRCIYTVLEQLPGGSLREMFDRNRRLTPSQGLVVGLDICRGMTAMHRANWVHGDIRPANIVFDAQRRARLGAIDVLTRETIGEADLERARYAAPEVGQGLAPSEKSDVYSLALVLVEAITGELPFSADSVTATLANRVDKLLPVSADLGALASVLERAARPDAESRFTAREFGEALVAVAKKVPPPTPVDVVGIGHDELLIPMPVSEQGSSGQGSSGQGSSGQGSSGQGSSGQGSSEQDVIDLGDAGDPTGELTRPSLAATNTKKTDIAVDAPPSEELVAEIVHAKRSRRRALKVVAVVVLLALVGGGVFGYSSLRKESFQVPVLIGLAEGEARNQIINYKWDIVVREGRSDLVKTGEVIGTEPGDGVKLKEGESFVIVVSQGPTFSTLEDFANVPEETAVAKINQLGLVPTTTKVNDETVAAGTVMSWAVVEQPSAKVGDEVVKGTSILLNVSSGPAPRAVPNLVGLTPAEAEAKITELGLVFTVLAEDFSKDAAIGLVGGQLPIEGETLPRGGSISYWLSKGANMVALPKLIGEYKATVEERITEAGFVVGKSSGVTTRKLKAVAVDGKGVSTGTKVPEGSTIDLIYYG